MIRRDGPLPFADFMALVLYHPDLGYYAREPRQVGRDGDFFTSVSVGPLFGALLARRFIKEWNELGSPPRWRIVECGAHDGTLAADILRAISRLDAAAFSSVEYVISEPLPRLREAQRETLAGFLTNTRFVSGERSPGIAFGNELLDALPFHVVERRDNSWQACLVGMNDDGFHWETGIVDPEIRKALDKLGNDFPEGYRTEIRTNIGEFLEPLTRCLSTGVLIWFDYGFARPELYHPDRVKGTLRTFSNHRAAEDPLAGIGEIDITAHVDFTAVAEAAMSLGAIPTCFRNQGTWLTEIGREWLLTLEGQPSAEGLRQFQTLTHPAHLGGSFHVLELALNRPEATIPSAEIQRLALSACPMPRSR
jgi:SAM-dependent MidA family methyltransferase